MQPSKLHTILALPLFTTYVMLDSYHSSQALVALLTTVIHDGGGGDLVMSSSVILALCVRGRHDPLVGHTHDSFSVVPMGYWTEAKPPPGKIMSLTAALTTLPSTEVYTEKTR